MQYSQPLANFKHSVIEIGFTDLGELRKRIAHYLVEGWTIRTDVWEDHGVHRVILEDVDKENHLHSPGWSRPVRLK